jgi:DNA polymerase V
MAEVMGATGFQSPCAEYAEDALSLDQKIITHKNATFFIRAQGVSKALKIESGDLLVIDRSLHPNEADIVLAAFEGRFIITKVLQREGNLLLYPWKKIVHDPDQLKVEGVVKAIVREYRK